MEEAQVQQQIAQPLYRHAKRKQWGLAILAWEADGKRGYQFQDGQLRTFKDGYYHLMVPAQKEQDEALPAVRDLKAMLRASVGSRQDVITSTPSSKKVSIEEQIRVFRTFYPKGFEGDPYTKSVRGNGAKKILKRHRDSTLELAKEKLSKDSLSALIEAEDHEAVRDALVDVLSSTDMVNTKDLTPLKEMDENRMRELSGALYELLYGESPFEARFSRYVSILTVAAGGRISWPLASVPAALVHPEEHVAIKPSVFRQQAAWMAPSMRYDANPQPKVYQRFRSMAQTIFDRLTEAGLKPRDMLDVRHFIWTTLRPKGLTMLEDMRVKMGD